MTSGFVKPLSDALRISRTGVLYGAGCVNVSDYLREMIARGILQPGESVCVVSRAALERMNELAGSDMTAGIRTKNEILREKGFPL